MNPISFLKGGSKTRQSDAEDPAGKAQADPSEPGADFTDHYEVLELSFGASPSAEDIRKAFHRLAKAYHPDKTQGDEDKMEKFKEINEAYHALSDEKVKEAFDAMCWTKAQREEEARKKRTDKKFKMARRAQDPAYTDIVQIYQSELARMREEQGLPVSSHQAKKNKWVPPRPSVLLVDEVDVFFGNGFYGQPYQPSVNIDTDNRDGYKLLRHIWQERDTYLKEGKCLFEDKIMKRPEVKKLQKVFPNLTGDILKR
jgi:curved DNA-binding protein